MIDLLYTITPLKLLTQSLWRDEAFSYLMARMSLIQIIKATANDFNPPLYYFFLHYWMRIFGVSEIALRGLSLFFFAISLYIVHLFIEEIFKIKGWRSWIYLLFFGMNPFLLYFAFEARMYSLVVLLSLLSFYYFHIKKTKHYSFVTLLGLYTHYFFIFVLATQLLYVLLIERKKIIKFIHSLVIPFILFTPWVMYIFSVITQKTENFWILKPTVFDVLIAPAVLFTGYERNYYTFYDKNILFLSLFLVIISIYFYTNKNKSTINILMSIWSFVCFSFVLLVSFIKPIFLPRYLIFSAVGFNLFLIFGIEHSHKIIRSILLLILFVVMIDFWSKQIPFHAKENERDTILAIQSLARANDVLYVTDPSHYFVASYYFDEKRVFIYKKEVKSIPHYIGAVLIPAEKIVYSLPRYPIKAFVMKNSFDYDIKTSY